MKFQKNGKENSTLVLVSSILTTTQGHVFPLLLLILFMCVIFSYSRHFEAPVADFWTEETLEAEMVRDKQKTNRTPRWPRHRGRRWTGKAGAGDVMIRQRWR